MANKKCAQCGQDKSIEDFSKSYKNLCKECVAYNEKLKRSMRVSTEQPWGQPFNASRIQIDSNSPQFIPNPRFIASIVAMQGMIGSRVCMKSFHRELSADLDAVENTDMYSIIAKNAVLMADALINELSKPKDENNN